MGEMCCRESCVNYDELSMKLCSKHADELKQTLCDIFKDANTDPGGENE